MTRQKLAKIALKTKDVKLAKLILAEFGEKDLEKISNEYIHVYGLCIKSLQDGRHTLDGLYHVLSKLPKNKVISKAISDFTQASKTVDNAIKTVQSKYDTLHKSGILYYIDKFNASV